MLSRCCPNQEHTASFFAAELFLECLIAPVRGAVIIAVSSIALVILPIMGLILTVLNLIFKRPFEKTIFKHLLTVVKSFGIGILKLTWIPYLLTVLCTLQSQNLLSSGTWEERMSAVRNTWVLT